MSLLQMPSRGLETQRLWGPHLAAPRRGDSGEPRCVRDPTADDFKDQTPVVIRELILRRICCVMTLRLGFESNNKLEGQRLEGRGGNCRQIVLGMGFPLCITARLFSASKDRTALASIYRTVKRF